MSFSLLIIAIDPTISAMNMLLFGLILSLNQGLDTIGLDTIYLNTIYLNIIGLNIILLKYYPTLLGYANLNIRYRWAQCAVALSDLIFCQPDRVIEPTDLKILS
ncbi:Uncharacterised protein [Psychrobacter phenylpyruvicus]|uniref:Uncharacterized protein n=1 Tax=Psychrobacter phenylpyruvicus TaxID=29432 RepID=A0A379LHW0_9GAMM|nr:Uncharacterised protein [Psychrobacter phenylpyruvicus]